MKIMVNGINANLRFSSAHIIPAHDSCGFIHGHSYFVDIEIEGKRSGDFDFVVDFKDVKKSVKKICKTLDHRILIPINNKNMFFEGISELKSKPTSKSKFKSNSDYKFNSKNNKIKSKTDIRYNNTKFQEIFVSDFENMDYLEFSIQDKEYKLPLEDCVLLPLEHSSAEDLSKYFADKVFNDLSKIGYNIDSVSVCVNEGIGQGAYYKKTI